MSVQSTGLYNKIRILVQILLDISKFVFRDHDRISAWCNAGMHAYMMVEEHGARGQNGPHTRITGA
jgi:hypothetical protein